MNDIFVDHAYMSNRHIIHPHPIVSLVRAVSFQNMQEATPELFVFNPWFFGLGYFLPCMTFMMYSS